MGFIDLRPRCEQGEFLLEGLRKKLCASLLPCLKATYMPWLRDSSFTFKASCACSSNPSLTLVPPFTHF